jgi:hypothetical protein
MGGGRAVLACALVFFPVLASAIACGETRRPIGDECLRGDDCLSGVCADRTCVSAPSLVTGAQSQPPDGTPRIPVSDGQVAPQDAGDAG